jgi:hypothetical protein
VAEIESVLFPTRLPNVNADIERFVRSLKGALVADTAPIAPAEGLISHERRALRRDP